MKPFVAEESDVSLRGWWRPKHEDIPYRRSYLFQFGLNLKIVANSLLAETKQPFLPLSTVPAGSKSHKRDEDRLILMSVFFISSELHLILDSKII